MVIISSYGTLAGMKLNITPTNREVTFDKDSIIVSKTDLKGRLLYTNRKFMDISGFSEPELLGQQHNIVRHPDMPRSIFNLLWQTIKQGKECFAYVKNITKNGDHYWVFANITPDYDEKNNICGYFSVRRKPKGESLAVIEPLYKKMLAAEMATNSKEAIAAGTQVLNDHMHMENKNYEAFILSI